ncbi:hypothetical protein FQN57_004873 [Myotisia sp. PD_48]|nr:hypothetical protein FQN57_004873 [Myotisia sp. PD_48]
MAFGATEKYLGYGGKAERMPVGIKCPDGSEDPELLPCGCEYELAMIEQFLVKKESLLYDCSDYYSNDKGQAGEYEGLCATKDTW